MNVRIIATGACREVEKKRGEHDMLENTEIKRKKKKEREREVFQLWRDACIFFLLLSFVSQTKADAATRSEPVNSGVAASRIIANTLHNSPFFLVSLFLFFFF